MSRPSGKSPLGTTDPVTENSKGCSRLCRQFTFTSRLQARLLPLCDCDLPFKHDVPSSTTALQDCLRDQSSATSPLRDLLILDTRPPGPPLYRGRDTRDQAQTAALPVGDVLDHTLEGQQS